MILRSVLVAATVVKKSLEISVHYFANPRVRQNVAGLCDRWVSIPIILTSERVQDEWLLIMGGNLRPL